MEKEIETFISYLHNVKKTSDNTEMSYKRDLEKLNYFLTTKGIQDVTTVTTEDLDAYVKHLEDHRLATATISRNIVRS